MRFAVIVLLGVALSGCGTVAPIPEDVFLRLDVPAPSVVAAPWTPDSLRVALLTAAGVHNERAVMVTRDGVTLRRHPYFFWTADPPHLVQQTLQSYLAAAQVAKQVVTERGTGEGLVVDGALERFEYDLTAPPGALVLKMVLRLVDAKRGRVVLEREFSAEQRVSDSTAAALAHGLQAAVARVYADFVTEAANTLKSQVAEE